jgi:Membrane-associated phospholipid phosphatase
MKQIYVIIFVCQLISLSTYGQEDSLKTRINPPNNQIIDNISLKNDSMILQRLKNDTNVLNQSDFTFENKVEANTAYGFTKQMRNLYNTPYTKFVIPVALITIGAVVNLEEEEDREIQLKVATRNYKRSKVDDYLQFAPITAVYGLDLIGVKAKHNFRDRVFVSTVSCLIMGTTVSITKSQTHILRPDGSNYLSFPSGHTANAFVGAHILFKEYNHVSPWISVAGYSAATLTGIMRVRNNKHWTSDVIAGAGVGMLSVELGYFMLPLFHKIIGISADNKNLVVVPTVGNNNYGLGLAYFF